MAPTYKVRYFDTHGAAEPIRQLLSYGKIPFEDERIAKEDWLKIKPTTPLGQLPLLVIDGKEFPQTIPICRYLGKKVNLAGNDDLENLKIDIAVETLTDVQKSMREFMSETDATKKQEKQKSFNETLRFYLGKLEEYSKKHGGYLALDRLSWADVFFTNCYEILVNIMGAEIFDAYPSLQQVKNNVISQPGIKEWIQNRPKVTSGPITYTFDLKQDL